MDGEIPEFFVKLILTAVLAVLSGIDIKKKQLPGHFLALSGCVLIICGAIRFCKALPDDRLSLALDSAFGMLPGLLTLFAGFISRGQIGSGDGIFMLMTGMLLGGAVSMEVFMLSLFLVFIFSGIGLISKKLSRKSQLPFVPFYLAAYIGVVYL